MGRGGYRTPLGDGRHEEGRSRSRRASEAEREHPRVVHIRLELPLSPPCAVSGDTTVWA